MTQHARETGPGRARRLFAAALIYFAVVFGAGLVLGPARVFWIEPWLGPTLAVLCEAPFLVAAMIAGAWLAPRIAGLGQGWQARLLTGVLALLMQQIADLSVGFGLRGMALQEQIAYFRTPAGYVYIAMLVLFAAMPLIVYWRLPRTASSRDSRGDLQ
jgi:hypothetical protein